MVRTSYAICIAGKPLIRYTYERVKKIFNKEPVIISSKANAEELSQAGISSTCQVTRR